jgi:hypothetical protein
MLSNVFFVEYSLILLICPCVFNISRFNPSSKYWVNIQKMYWVIELSPLWDLYAGIAKTSTMAELL